MDYKLTGLPSGLRVLTAPMPSLESATLTVWVKTGSRNEEEKTLGLSHFLEHMVFKGSKKYKDMQTLFEIFDGMGAEHNAGTSKEWTNFWIKVGISDIERGFDILSDVVLNPLLKVGEMEKERKVIFEEMKMYEDYPARNIIDIFEETIYRGNPLAWDTIGTVESMNRIIRNSFMEYRKRNYFAENMLVSVAGGVNQKDVLLLAQKYFSGISNAKSQMPNSQFKTKQTQPQFRLKQKKTDQAHLMLGFLADGRNYQGKYIQSVLSGILGGGASSRLFSEVREKRGLAYAVQGVIDRYSDAGYFGVYIGCDIKKSYDAIKVVLDQCYGLASKKLKITEKELEKIKGYLKGRLALRLEDSDAVNDFFSEQALFDNKVLTPEEVFEKIDGVTEDEIYNEAKKIFTPDRLNLAVIGPYKSEEKFVQLL